MILLSRQSVARYLVVLSFFFLRSSTSTIAINPIVGPRIPHLYIRLDVAFDRRSIAVRSPSRRRRVPHSSALTLWEPLVYFSLVYEERGLESSGYGGLGFEVFKRFTNGRERAKFRKILATIRTKLQTCVIRSGTCFLVDQTREQKYTGEYTLAYIYARRLLILFEVSKCEWLPLGKQFEKFRWHFVQLQPRYRAYRQKFSDFSGKYVITALISARYFLSSF